MEVWKPIYFEQGYEVNEYGKVRNIKTGLILSSWNLKNGYEQIQIRKNAYSIHRLVAKVFHPLSEFVGAIVLHLDDNKKNNHYLNLKWGTQSENIQTAYKKGRMSKKGVKHHLAKFTENQIKQIRIRLDKGETCVSISKDFKVCHQTISNIKLKKSWT